MTKKITKLMLNGEEYEIREYQSGWRPGANTIAYYPLTSSSTTTDMSGNNLNLVNVNNVSFGTYNGVDCAYLDNTQYQGFYINQGNLMDTSTNRTFSFRVNRGSHTLYYNPRLFSDAGNVMIGTEYDGDFLVSRPFEDHTGFNISQGQWVYIVVTYDTNHQRTIYKNGEFYDSYSLTPVSNTGILTIGIGSTNPGSADDCWDGNMSEIIIEDKVWTAQEVQDYYNQTCESYGLQPITPWQPGANTMIYYNFANNVNDQSGNNNNAIVGGTISYGTNYVDLTSGKLQIPDISYANDMTISFWIKCNAESSTGFIFDAINTGHNKMIFRVEGSSMFSDYPSYSSCNYTYSTSRRYLVATFDSSGIKYYIDGSLVATKTAWSTAPGTSGGSYIGAGWDGGSGNPGLYAGYFIIEDRARTAQEVADYYNQTKGDYGIS